MLNHIPQYLVAFALTAFLIHTFNRPAKQVGLIDQPGGRKKHDGAIPLTGGISIFFSFCFIVLFLDGPLRIYSSLFAGMGILLIAGILDDLHDISAKGKLLMQLTASILMATWGDHTVHTLGNLFGTGEIQLGSWSIPFTVLCTVGLINAINMIDGMDGLAGGVIVTALAWLIYAGAMTHSTEATVLLITLIASIAGFLVFNFRHPWRKSASVFLGDAGSMMLGYSLAWFAVEISQESQSAISPMAIAWILALPIFDTVSLMIRRILKSQSPLAADREHLHHIFQRAGYSQSTTVYILVALSSLAGSIGVIGWQYNIPDYYLFVGILTAFLGYMYFVMHAWRIMKVLKRLRKRV